MKKRRIAVLAGGWSKEREISLVGGNAVYKALDREKYDVTIYDPKDDFKKIIDQEGNIDLAFILLHGKYGEDGCIQGLLRILGIPFVGSDVLSSALAVNKKISKKMYLSEDLIVAKDVIIKNGEEYSIEKLMGLLGHKTVVKPLDEGSSIGMSICENGDELALGIEKAFQYGTEIMIEAFIEGRELTCCVLGNRRIETLPLIEIIPDRKYRFFDYEAKYTPGATKEICPAEIDRETKESAEACAVKAHRALKCRVWSRTDMIVRNGEIYVLETNTIPGMTENSLFPLAAKAAGMSFSTLLDRLIDLSLEDIS